MNKVNVFLLAVVSSLLTYISTATQPAATAGVAQEKWEWGIIEWVEHSFRSGNAQYSGADFPDGYVSVRERENSPGRYDIISVRGGKIVDSYPGTTGSSAKSGLDDFMVSNTFLSQVRKRVDQCFEDGWEPFQVIEEGHVNLRKKVENREGEPTYCKIYVRRRVQ